MTVLMATASGEQHGLVNTLTNSSEFNDFKHMDPKTKAKCEKDRKEDARLVKARYINHRGAHERLDKPYCRWAGDPIKMYHLIPGYTYELPLGMVNEVNEMRMMKRSGLVSQDDKNVTPDGSPLAQDQNDNKIHELVPVSF
jgi:hypothetical protein